MTCLLTASHFARVVQCYQHTQRCLLLKESACAVLPTHRALPSAEEKRLCSVTNTQSAAFC